MVEIETISGKRFAHVVGPIFLSVVIAIGGISLAGPRLLIEIAGAGFSFWADPAGESDQAQRLLREAARTPDAGKNQRADARDHLRRALSGAPARAWDWARIAWLGEMGVASWPEAAGAFRMAALTERFSPELTPVLVATGLRLWPVLDAAQRQALADLTHRQWQWGPGRLAEIAYELYAKPQVEELLADDPEALADLRKRFDAVAAGRSG